MSTAPITTIVADFGGVLSSPLQEAFAAVGEHFDLPPEALGAAMATVGEALGAPPLHELECGRLSEERFFALVDAQLGADLGRDVGFGAFPDVYWAALRPNTPLIERLRELRREGYRMGLLTNNVVEWQPRWRAMVPVEELFDDVVDSGEVGMRKPDPEIYALTADRLGVHAHEIVFLDDFVSNCDAAREAGWTPIRFETAEQTIAELDALLADRGAPPLASGAVVLPRDDG
jgi:putative hydrolase of the HAD superfamily